MWRVVNTLVPIGIIIAIVIVFRTPLFVFSYQAAREVAPCRITIPYAIAQIDPGFDVSHADVARAARDAVSVWEKAAGRDLFNEIATGTPVIEVSLRYDLRQQTTEQLRDLGDKLSDSNATYDELDAQYKSKRSQFLSDKASFEAEAASFERDAEAYQREVDMWNARGGASQSTFTKLNAEKAALLQRQNALAQHQVRVNALADEVNTLARRLNAIAGDINATARTYNKVGEQTGDEFEEGVYESRAGKETITVFEFDSQARLTRLLAHEFGHALGLDHVENKESIMYRLNQGSNITPTSEDIAALRAVCRLP